MLIHFDESNGTVTIELNMDEAKEYVVALGETPGTDKIDYVIFSQISDIVEDFNRK